MPGENNFSVSVIVDKDTLHNKINLEGNELINSVAERFATFRRNFFASPFEMVMNALVDEKSVPSTGLGNLCFSLRPKEKTWLIYNSS